MDLKCYGTAQSEMLPVMTLQWAWKRQLPSPRKRCTDVGYLRATFGPPGVRLLAHTLADETPGAATLLLMDYTGQSGTMWEARVVLMKDKQDRHAAFLCMGWHLFVSSLYICFDLSIYLGLFRMWRIDSMLCVCLPSTFYCLGWGGLTASFRSSFLLPSMFCCLR